MKPEQRVSFPDTRAQTVYKLGTITFVPSYSDPGLFRVPGGGMALVSQLLALGARKATHQLWSRVCG